MNKNFEERTSGTLLTAVFPAGMTAVAIQGNYVYFAAISASLAAFAACKPLLVCGICGGLLGGAFSQLLIWSSQRPAPLTRKQPVMVAATCGAVIALIGMPGGNLTFGTGYHAAGLVIGGEGTLPAAYPALKMFATLASYPSGIPGGIFSPSLATGAGMGSTLSAWIPDVASGAVITLGMVGYFTGVVQTPVTAMVIVIEMTRDTGLVLPLMATAFIAHIFSRLICPESICPALSKAFLISGNASAAPAGTAINSTDNSRD